MMSYLEINGASVKNFRLSISGIGERIAAPAIIKQTVKKRQISILSNQIAVKRIRTAVPDCFHCLTRLACLSAGVGNLLLKYIIVLLYHGKDIYVN